MLTAPKSVLLLFKKLSLPYAAANDAVYVEEFRSLGPTISVVNAMLSHMEEQKEYMASILGLSANDPKWSEKLSYYWNSISVDIPSHGRTLEIGFEYDVNSISKMPYVQSYNKTNSNAPIESDEDAHKYFTAAYDIIVKTANDGIVAARKLNNGKDQEKYINDVYKKKYDSIIKLEQLKYKFGNPINIEDYMLYRMCLLHSHVANEMALSDKSNHIRFYLHSEEEIKLQKERDLKLETDRMTAFLDVVKSPEKVENVLYAMKQGDKVLSMQVADKNVLLNNISLENPSKFIRVVSDSNLATIGKIEKYITFGILNRLPNSEIVVDALKPDVILGNSITEVIVYFNNEQNKGIISEYAARYNSLPKK